MFSVRVWWWLALLAVVAVRLYGLPQTALPDYDSVRNWQIVQELARGDLHNLFRHGSPAFYLLYAPVAWLTADYRVFQHLNALVAVAALAVLVEFAARELSWRGWQAAAALLFGGTSVFLTFSGHDFTMGSVSLLAFAGLLRAHYARLRHPSPAALLRAAAWLALGLSFNYKFLLTLPILLLLELLCGHGLLWQPANLARVLAVLAAPYVVLGAVGVLSGLPWHRWPAVYYNIVFPGAHNAAGRAGPLRFDGLYYLRYLWDFESPLLLPGVLVGVGWLRFRRAEAPPLPTYLAVWAGCFLLGMSLLLKAPRGLLLAYPLLYILAFEGLRRATQTYVASRLSAVALVTLAAAAVAFNLHRIRQEIYAYAPTNYRQVAAWLHARQPGRPVRLATTLSLGLAPFLSEADTLVPLTNERELPKARQLGCRYVLLDATWRVAGTTGFDSLRRQPPLMVWPAPQLTAPLLFLEHSEYTGLGYRETLARQQAGRQDSAQLFLYCLPESSW